jgi:holo-[acyl-carrier protein] synthase
VNIGVDIVEVPRIAKLIRNRHFLARVYTDEEILYCKPKKNRAQHFAVRFAAKEAVWKAIREKSVSLKDISVKNLPGGKPQALIKKKVRKDIDISLSHTDQYAVAVAIVK